MSDKYKTLPAEEVIDKFGGLRPLANRLGIAPSTVQGWKERGVVPENRVPQVLDAAVEDGIILRGHVQQDVEDVAKPDAAPEPKAQETAAPKPEAAAEVKADATSEPKTDAPAPSQPASKFVASSVAPAATAPSEDDRRDHRDRRSAGDRRQKQDPNFTGPDRRINDRRSGLDRRQQRAAEWQHKKKFMERSMLTFAFLFIVIVLAGVFIMMPEYKAMQQQAAQYETMQKELATMNRQLATIKEDRTSISGRINEGLNQLERTKEEIMQQVKTAEEAAAQVANSNWQQRFSMAEQKIFGLRTMMNQVEGLINTPGGREALENSLRSLESTMGQYGGTITQDDLNVMRQQDPILATVMKDVRAEDVKAALMLLTLNEVRTTMGRETSPFADDLKLLQDLNQDDPQVQASIQRLAPYAQSGVLSQQRLSDEFQGLAGDIVMAKLRGEDASIQNRAMERLSQMMTVRRIDSAEGDNADAIVVRAQAKIDQGDISGAIAELQKLEGESAKTAAPWIAQAQNRVYADQASSALTMDIMQNLMREQNMSPEGLQSLIQGLLHPLRPTSAVVSQPKTANPGAIQGTYPGLTR